MLAFWALRSPRPLLWAVAIGAVGLLALWLDFRGRIAVALVTALLLIVVQHSPALRKLHGGRWLQKLGQMSYSVFLVHFSVCLVVNALVHALWPEVPWLNALGMAVAFGLSLVAGRLLYLRVERHVPSWQQAMRWQAGLVGAGLLVALVSSRFSA